MLALCTGTDGRIPGPHVQTAEALEADPDILYPVMKKLLTELAGRTEDHAGEMRLIPVIAGCIRLLHDSGILPERIETDFPHTVRYRYSYTEYAGDGYEGRYTGEKSGEATVW